MRTWRVGTFSMGASLLFLGIFLLLSQLFGLRYNTCDAWLVACNLSSSRDRDIGFSIFISERRNHF